MKRILKFSIVALISLSMLSCSNDEDSELVNKALSEARTLMEAAAILSNYNLEPEAQINLQVTISMNLNNSLDGVHVGVQSAFETPPMGLTVAGDLNVQPFGDIPVYPDNDTYRINDAFLNTGGYLISGDYPINYTSNNTYYSSFNTDMFMDFSLLVDNNLEYRDGGKYYLNKSEGVNLTWTPLQQTGSEVYVGLCAVGEKCFYAKIPDSGSYTFDSDVYSGLSSGTSVTLLLARGYQECLKNSDKDVCITNFTLASGGVIDVR